MIKIWHHFYGRKKVQFISVATEALAQVGISSRAFDPERSSGPGIIFFDEATQGLYDFLREVNCRDLGRVLVIATSQAVLAGDVVWHLLKAGACDVFAWDHFHNPTKEMATRFERWDAVDQLINSPLVTNWLVGQGPVWKSLLRRIVEIARFSDASILITGESGTGKELVARLIHALDPRPDKRDLVILDCAAVVPELSGSEFFGHQRGAFTGALTPREGAFALAHSGTLFLDEIGELPVRLQAQLLRVIQEHTYKRLGEDSWQRTDFRLVCATNKNLLQAVKCGEFRHDLYYRIAGWTCQLPPLREHPEDILPLARHFMSQHTENGVCPEIDEPVRSYLLNRDYPGNVRDLKQLISRIMYCHVGPGPITVGDIPAEDRSPVRPGPAEWRDEHFYQAIHRALEVGVRLKDIGNAAEETAVKIAVDDEQGNLQRAARKLGITDRALQMRRVAQRQRQQAQATHVDTKFGQIGQRCRYSQKTALQS